ncbi:hypothetical protein QBZ16_000382 [Prototheca wickerhamii]|uniref:NOC3-like protein n=1 Tax=Prototheca wickerhamii TaxID=3111 RepID=A0AAD9INC5_PROWI|nr:hypothetical protein QBZ16_000382 [Prototheca wickerhamii]
MPARERMALAAQAVLAEPERQLAQLADLVELAQPGAFVPGVTRLALLSCAAVFADIVPGYRIRTVAEEEGPAQMLSKEVRELRRFEQGLLRQYQRYLRAALHELTGGARDPAGARVAARCLCRSLLAAPHFNYTTDILQAIVPVVAARDPALRAAALGALGDLVAGTSADGAVVTEAIQLLADVVKRRDCVCPREVVGVLARLTTADIASLKDLRADAQKNRKKSKKKKHKRDEVDAAFAESQAVTDAEARRHQQATSLEAVFEIYFRVLKHATASGLFAETEGKPLSADRFAKRFPLLFPVLEQLARHAHLIGIEYFGDLMAVFDKLLASSALPPAERVRTLLTVASILGGQGDALNVDRGAFYLHLYRALDLVCLQEPEEDEEDGAVSKGKARGVAPNSATAETPRSAPPRVGPLLVQLCERMLTDRKALDSARQAAFAKRLAATAAAARDPGLALGLLTLLNRLLRQNVRLAAMLHNESGGPAGFRTLQLDARDPAEAGALATPLWELALLSRHWHPTVSQVAAEVAQGAAQAGLAALPPAAGPAEVAERCSTDRGGFRPGAACAQGRHAQACPGAAAPEDAAAVEARLAAPPAPWTESFLALVAGAQGEGLSKRARKKQRREAAAADAAETLAGREEENEGGDLALDEAALQAAFRAFFRASRRFEEHQRLLLQKHRLLAQLQAFERRRREWSMKK